MTYESLCINYGECYMGSISLYCGSTINSVYGPVFLAHVHSKRKRRQDFSAAKARNFLPFTRTIFRTIVSLCIVAGVALQVHKADNSKKVSKMESASRQKSFNMKKAQRNYHNVITSYACAA